MRFFKNIQGNSKQDALTNERLDIKKCKLPKYVMTSDEKLEIV